MGKLCGVSSPAAKPRALYSSTCVGLMSRPINTAGRLIARISESSNRIRLRTAWYGRYAERCLAACRVPSCLAVEHRSDGVLLLLEDLNAAGFAGRRRSVSDAEVNACLSWLANFHATFMGEQPKELWTIGTYWHLATRPDELDALDDSRLKAAAGELDRRLSGSPFQTFCARRCKTCEFLL